jgi:hypothetical protein
MFAYLKDPEPAMKVRFTLEKKKQRIKCVASSKAEIRMDKYGCREQ